MLIDLHGHTSGISTCCRLDALEIAKHALAVGLDGYVLTNHLLRLYLEKHQTDYKGLIKKYIKEYNYAKSVGEELGCKVFFGVELSMDYDINVHLLIYGIDEEYLLSDHTPLYELSQKELYNLCKQRGWALVQGHPFRNGDRLQDLDYLDGLEINCHQGYSTTSSDVVPQLSNGAGLMITCGGDYHGDRPRSNCGVYLPDDVKDEKDIASFILNTKEVKLRIQEIGATDFYEKEYKINRK